MLVAAGLGCGEPGGLPAIGPQVVAPRLLPPSTTRPELEQPRLAQPELVPAPVVTPPLQRAVVVDPLLVDPYQVDEYSQKVLKVDVLWIVDNSGSMANERSLLAASFQHFIEELVQRHIDYHVGVISTQVDSAATGGELREARGVRVITPEVADQVALFAELVDFPSGSERLEQGLAAMRLALDEAMLPEANRDFLRADSALAVVVVSDEDDGSFGHPAHYARFLQRTRRPGDERLATFSAIVGLPPDGCVPEGDEEVFGADVPPATRYLAVSELTGGVSGSICLSDFEPLLERLGQRVGALNLIFPLSAIPVLDTLAVRVDGRLVPPAGEAGAGWRYHADIRAVVFDEESVPPSGRTVRIAYVVDRGEIGRAHV